ncbi:MAG: nicotinate-nucleotide--dimethylbenzimidazole phosphoribosyltransferase, partial [Lentisphaeria bacterium]|nr:nicotinate-nucleotide--dimethylbenzimidazole phosphoribosyltransferase [Lentisphaeria bacterium]
MTLLEETLARISSADAASREKVRQHILQLTMPTWALGRVLDLAVDLAGITGDTTLPVARKEIILMAGDHGIVREGVCPQPSSVTEQMVRNFVRGGGAINILAANAGAHVTIADLGVDADLSDLAAAGAIRDCKIRRGTANFAQGPAMTREEARKAVETGISLVLEMADQVDVFATGEMGIGNTSPSSAILTVLAGQSDPAEFVGRGAGLAPEKLRHKAEVIRKGIELNQPDPADALDLLAKVGGLELGGIAGVILGAAS